MSAARYAPREETLVEVMRRERDQARADLERWKQDAIGELNSVLGQAIMERNEAREVARKLLVIARAHGAKPFGLSMAPWLEKPP